MDFTNKPEWQALYMIADSAQSLAGLITTSATEKDEKCAAYNILCRLDNTCKAIRKAREKNRKAMVRQ